MAFHSLGYHKNICYYLFYQIHTLFKTTKSSHGIDFYQHLLYQYSCRLKVVVLFGMLRLLLH